MLQGEQNGGGISLKIWKNKIIYCSKLSLEIWQKLFATIKQLMNNQSWNIAVIFKRNKNYFIIKKKEQNSTFMDTCFYGFAKDKKKLLQQSWGGTIKDDTPLILWIPSWNGWSIRSVNKTLQDAFIKYVLNEYATTLF